MYIHKYRKVTNLCSTFSTGLRKSLKQRMKFCYQPFSKLLLLFEQFVPEYVLNYDCARMGMNFETNGRKGKSLLQLICILLTDSKRLKLYKCKNGLIQKQFYHSLNRNDSLYLISSDCWWRHSIESDSKVQTLHQPDTRLRPEL